MCVRVYMCASPTVVRQEFARARESNRMNNILRIHHTAAERTLHLGPFVSEASADDATYNCFICVLYHNIARVPEHRTAQRKSCTAVHPFRVRVVSLPLPSGSSATATIVRGLGDPGTEL